MLKLFNKKKQKKIPPLLFIAASLGALIILPLFFLYLKSFFEVTSEIKNIERQTFSDNTKYYDMSDPFITKVINSEDMEKK